MVIMDFHTVSKGKDTDGERNKKLSKFNIINDNLALVI